jgi:putative membrane protein
MLAGLLIGGAGHLSADTSPSSSSEFFSIKQHFIEWMLTDQKFVEKAVESGRAEIEASKLALQKSDNKTVSEFAKRMVDDHTKASLDLKEIAQNTNIKIPIDLSSEHTDKLKKLVDLSGEQFDLAYIDMMKKEHDQDESLFVAASADKKLDAQLQDFARKTLPVIRDHLGHAKSLGTLQISSPD